jgi:hypothetical protein
MRHIICLISAQIIKNLFSLKEIKYKLFCIFNNNVCRVYDTTLTRVLKQCQWALSGHLARCLLK